MNRRIVLSAMAGVMSSSGLNAAWSATPAPISGLGWDAAGNLLVGQRGVVRQIGEMGNLLRQFGPVAEQVHSLAVSPDGSWLAVGALRTVTLWSLAATDGARPPQRLTGFPHRVTALAFHPSSRRLVTGSGTPSQSGDLRICDLSSAGVWQLGAAFGDHSDVIYGAAFVGSGSRLVTGSADKNVKLWALDGRDGKPAAPQFLRLFAGHTHYVLGVGAAPDGSWLASVGGDLALKTWNTESGEQLSSTAAHEKEASVLVMAPDGRPITGGADRLVKIWNPRGGGPQRSFPAGGAAVTSLAARPDALAVGHWDGTVTVYDLKSGAVKRQLPST